MQHYQGNGSIGLKPMSMDQNKAIYDANNSTIFVGNIGTHVGDSELVK